ncbi:SIS domain-containing protein, partial [candidate division WOR-3 bacterium]|nr:SIS domain-containing protein [candidate division WOR-3 bacterium]
MVDTKRKALEIIADSISVKKQLKSEVERIEKASKVVLDALKKGKKILLCGNGGSAADAQHIA